MRNAQAKLAVLDAYDEREELGEIHADATATMNERRLDVARAAEKMRAELSGIADPVERSEDDKGISLRQLAEVLPDGSALVEDSFMEMRERWLDRILGAERPANPSAYHAAYVRRLSPLRDVYSKERATEVCLATLTELGFDLAGDKNIRTDLEDRPQKTPRPCVIPADPPTVVHLITRPQGGLPDYQGFLHEAGHALHYAGCDPDLPYTFRALSRDHALTEIYSFLVESITREPGWHERHFDLSPAQAAENADATIFLHAFLFRRYVAKFLFEMDFWSRFPEDGGTSEGYAERLTEATGYVYRADGSSPTWMRASTPPTTSARGSAPPRCASTCSPRWARTGGATRRRAISCGSSSGRARSPRARTLPASSASTHSISARSYRSSRARPSRSARPCKRPHKTFSLIAPDSHAFGV